MNELKKKIEAFAKKEGIDLIGFGDRSRFEGVSERCNPFTVFPEAKTVIMVGKRICRGSLRGVEEGTNFGDYALFGKNWLEDEFLALSAYNLSYSVAGAKWGRKPGSHAVIDYYNQIIDHTGYFSICGAKGCIRACNDRMEKAKREEQSFHNPYYKKKSWSLPLQPAAKPTGINPYREEYLDEHYPGIRDNEYVCPTAKKK